MKYLFVILFFVSSPVYGQLSMSDAKTAAAKYELGSYSYHEQYTGHAGYAAPIVLTTDGGATFFGDHQDKEEKNALLVKLDKNGKEEWKQTIRPQFDEIESQSVVQDRKGNYYVFMLTYDYKRYRGGCQRIVYLDKDGAVLWDKTIGGYELVNSPTFSYIRLLKDERLSLRGHVVTKKPGKGEDPKYRYWEGWINNQGKLTQKTGDVIDWSNQDWEKLFKPESETLKF